MKSTISAAAILTTVIAGGCATTPKTAGEFCDVARVIRPVSGVDEIRSDSTKRAIVYHNELGEKKCGWKP